MRPNVKPIVAVVAISLATSAFAAMGGKEKTTTKASSCGPVFDTKLDRMMNGNSHMSHVASCWKDHMSISGDVLLDHQNIDDIDGNTDSYFNVRSLNIYLDAAVSKAYTAHVALNAESQLANNMPSGETIDHNLTLDEAFLTVSNFMKSPMFVKAGKSYTPFGAYQDAHPTVFSINQRYVQANNTNIALGFASNAGYSLKGFVYEDQSSNDWDQFGLTLGYAGDLMGAAKGMKVGLNLSYVDNYASLANGGDGSFDNTESAYNLAAGLKVRDFKFGVEYFKVSGDLMNDTVDSDTGDTITAYAGNSKPSVLSFKAGYDFKAVGRNANIHAGYEKARDASLMPQAGSNAQFDETAESGTTSASMMSPEKHTNVGIGVNVDKNARFGVDYHRFEYFDQDSDQTQYVASMKVMF